IDVEGKNASPISSDSSKYERVKAILEQLTGVKESGPKTGYAAFAPTIEIFLKEHLFADIFERDILTYQERELVTISILSSLGNVDPMLQSHLNICLKQGIEPIQLQDFAKIITNTLGRKSGKHTLKIINEVISIKN
ncbi:MAG: carboxymuconolactone decarboxylase, partial [Pseudopedobacter saltans]